MAELPEVIPVFPLPNAVLFPHVDLPLHIFEPRYRDMVRDAMAGDRLIGMVLLRGDWRKDYHGAPEVFPVGCVGRIERFALLPDGRSNLVLHGLRRFKILEELAGRTYRLARVEWCADVPDPAGEAAGPAPRLKSSVSRLLARRARELPADLWERLPRDSEMLVNTLASVLDLEPIEKLALLECDRVCERTERLLEILEFHLARSGVPASTPRDDEPRH
ncbi:MAG: LON peptidase substrate-binding domain-containing protein [Thermodesulfobacteriota bacterium]